MKPSKHMLGDKAYDSAELRDELHERGTQPVIPNRSNRKQPFRFSKRLYKLRWRIAASQRARTGWLETTWPLSVWPQPLYGGFNESGP